MEILITFDESDIELIIQGLKSINEFKAGFLASSLRTILKQQKEAKKQ